MSLVELTVVVRHSVRLIFDMTKWTEHRTYAFGIFALRTTLSLEILEYMQEVPSSHAIYLCQ